MRKHDLVKRVLAAGMMMTLGASLLTGCSAEDEIKDFSSYAKDVEDITLSDEVRVVALGEATHGNKEFQELKLDVFAHLVETTDVRAFAIEGDFGSCMIANDYIVHDIGTAENAVKNLGFEIYRTDEMLELVQWMHDYNQGAKEDDKVRFYGFDMQRNEATRERIQSFYDVVAKEKGSDYAKRWEEGYGTGDGSLSSESVTALKELVDEMIADMESQRDVYIKMTDEETHAYALQSATCLLQHLGLHDTSSGYQGYADLRDQYMAENVRWILDREENVYGTKLMIAGHNGHVARVVNSAYTNMGSHLAEEFGESYYVIGTDFYKTNCSIATKEARENYKFCSDDPLAKVVGDMDENRYFLDFKEAKASEELSALLDSNMPTGSLGESYSFLMKFVKTSYQLRIPPAKLYDGMIFVYETTPIEVWDYQKK